MRRKEVSEALKTTKHVSDKRIIGNQSENISCFVWMNGRTRIKQLGKKANVICSDKSREILGEPYINHDLKAMSPKIGKEELSNRYC